MTSTPREAVVGDTCQNVGGDHLCEVGLQGICFVHFARTYYFKNNEHGFPLY